jgi:hypothetical protein
MSVSALTFLQATTPLVEHSASAFVTRHGWQGTLYQFASRAEPPGRRLIAVDFPIAKEHTVLYSWAAPGEADSVIESMRASVPFFRDNRTLAQLLAAPASTPLAEPDSTLPMFAEMRRRWSLEGVTFELATDPEAGRVEVKFAVYPRPSMVELLDSMKREIAANGGVRDVRVHHGTTVGSEYLGLAYVTGPTTERAIGAIYGDRHCVLVDAHYSIAQPAKFREFIARMTLAIPLRGCPTVRVRQVRHAVPEGWAVRTRDLTTHLIAPDATTQMTVLPVEPRDQESTTAKKIIYEDIISHPQLTTPITSTSHTTPTGLKAETFVVKGTSPDRRNPFMFSTAILTDERFRYTVRYEDRNFAHEEVFLSVVNSIEPIPPSPERAPDAMRRLFPVD